ncbi:Heparan sulfate glucosamine 3-O-sulfotransferase 3B1 [Holothuria leucospilota]|uniref:Heparan sulfate glucosamine 3-O-sulfotransferase 3B1 n=1 Tax=Holothuria leucospilota TaxID=206669 RepID=A0A9Q1BST3_HOLLE|nr:Heparan sulfate glucosamine 3-O-sulfotransferase 3B1 [Holothuria leucospilota]
MSQNTSNRSSSSREGHFSSGKNNTYGTFPEGCYVYSKGRLALSRSEVEESLQKLLNCEKRPPKAVILGVKKCGTETLTGLLDLHPYIVTSIYPVSNNGCISLENVAFERSIPLTTSDEIGLLDMVGMQYSPHKVSELLEFISNDTKFILILKDPIERAISDYKHVLVKMNLPKGKDITTSREEHVWGYHRNKEIGPEIVKYFKGYRVAKSFEKSVLNSLGQIDVSNKLIYLGFYYDYVQSIFYQISKERVLILDGQAFIEKPWSVLKQVESFLDVPSFFARKKFQKEGKFFCPIIKERPDSGCLKGKGRNKPRVNKLVLKSLKSFFRPLNELLRDSVGANLSWMQ